MRKTTKLPDDVHKQTRVREKSLTRKYCKTSSYSQDEGAQPETYLNGNPATTSYRCTNTLSTIKNACSIF